MTLLLTFPEITLKTGARVHENLDTPKLVETALLRGGDRMPDVSRQIPDLPQATTKSERSL
ncbi:hypothetical protein [Altererythrobacter sp. Root672]|uniref:hypothetical protein n=1 Tax=Altererythrobacter sp. Root672 TaxID=1736584 RepID=UPI0006F4189B|nr:hypothetical protein [Altererythrobacter sp. Root672]KRA79727.1 hypothetical protein ASD76_17040 [Altererythrobacter sp. Root672]